VASSGVEGSAEATTLPEACADFVAAGQAFHWFEPEKNAGGVSADSAAAGLGRRHLELP